MVIEGVRFYHGDYTAKGAGNSVRKAMDSLWQSVVRGHCHRQAVVKTRKHQEFVGVEAGCLCKMDPEYMKWMSTQFQNGSFVLCPNGGHMCMWDDQEHYFPGLISFLKQ